MNKFNARIAIKYRSELFESDEDGNPYDTWEERLAPIPAKREVVKGSLTQIATREQNIMYYKWCVWASANTRAILSTDRLVDITASDRVHEIMNVYESDDRREIIILTRSADAQGIYDAS